jgi:hypothetical protein
MANRNEDREMRDMREDTDNSEYSNKATQQSDKELDEGIDFNLNDDSEMR